MIVRKRSSWFATLFMVRGSTLTTTWPRLLAVTAFASVITYLHWREPDGLHLDLTITPFSLIGLALGIFLGFRNNTSYDRFWEGRKLWGRVVNASRTLTRQMLTLIGDANVGRPGYRTTAHEDLATNAEVHALHKRCTYRLIAYVHALRLHLRGQDDLSELEPFLDHAELEALRPELNRPIALLQRLGDEYRQAWDEGLLNAYHLPVLEGSLTELAGVQGGCERIKATPIPFSYNLLLHRIVAVYCFCLPLGLVDVVNLYTPIVVLLVSYAFFGLDSVGDEIEDPFGLDNHDLPLSAITRMIEVNLRQRLGETELPPLKQPVRFVLQ
ncbi:MAG: bestrophin family ion channel [Myxococcota bacterium]